MAIRKIANLVGRIDCPTCFSLLEWNEITDIHCTNGIEYIICPECGEHIILKKGMDYWVRKGGSTPSGGDDEGSDDGGEDGGSTSRTAVVGTAIVGQDKTGSE